MGQEERAEVNGVSCAERQG